MNHDPAQLKEYIQDHYGTCLRGSDCYWGRDASGQFNGCNRIGWKGNGCSHWQPVSELYKKWSAIYQRQPMDAETAAVAKEITQEDQAQLDTSAASDYIAITNLPPYKP